MSNSFEERELTLGEAAKRIGCSLTWARKLCDRDVLPSRRLGPTEWRLIPAEAVELYLRERDDRKVAA